MQKKKGVNVYVRIMSEHLLLLVVKAIDDTWDK